MDNFLNTTYSYAEKHPRILLGAVIVLVLLVLLLVFGGSSWSVSKFIGRRGKRRPSDETDVDNLIDIIEARQNRQTN